MKKNILLLSIVSLINDLSSKMILPILPLFIAQLGGGGIAVGLITGLGDSISSILKVLSGYWSDRLNSRKPFVFNGYLIAAFSKLGLFFANSWPFIFVMRTGERIGKGIRSAPRDSMLAASSNKRGKVFGFHRMFDSAGAVIGSLFTFALFWFFGFTLRNIILIAGLISFISIIPLFFTKDVKNHSTASKFVFKFANYPKRLKMFYLASSIFAIGNFSYMFFILKTMNLFEGIFVIAIPILLYTLFQMFYTSFAYPSGAIADKIGKDKVLLAGYSLMSIVALGFIFSSKWEHFLVFFALYGVMYALVQSNERAFVSDLSARSYRGTALGTFYTITSLASLPSGLLAGFLFEINQNYAFVMALVCSVVSTLLLLTTLKCCDTKVISRI
ncbi:MFS transporter [Candidatus Woesearchaeota archaeon]|nr:MFS transporter [Candidatus Woesearchaeota archaeon]